MPKVVHKPVTTGRRLSLPGFDSSEDSFVEAEPKVVTPVPKFAQSKQIKRPATTQSNSKRQKHSDGDDEPWKSAIPLPSIPLHPEELAPEDQVVSLKRLLRWYIGREKELLEFLEQVPKLQARVDQLTVALEDLGNSGAPPNEVRSLTFNWQANVPTGTFSKPPKPVSAKLPKKAVDGKEVAAAKKKKEEEERLQRENAEKAEKRKEKEKEKEKKKEKEKTAKPKPKSRSKTAKKSEEEKEKEEVEEAQKKTEKKTEKKAEKKEKTAAAVESDAAGPEAEPPTDGVFRIEELLAECESDGQRLHLVSWRDFPLKEATWEPLSPEVLASVVGRDWVDWKRANPGRTHKAERILRTYTKGLELGCALVELSGGNPAVMRLDTLPPELTMQSKR